MSLRSSVEELLCCSDAGQVDAASEAWDKIAKTAQDLIKVQPDDPLTLKLLLEALPRFLKASFESQGLHGQHRAVWFLKPFQSPSACTSCMSL